VGYYKSDTNIVHEEVFYAQYSYKLLTDPKDSY